MTKPSADRQGTVSAPSPRRRRPVITLGTGLQGKLVLCFVFLTASALGASCWLFVSETRGAFDRMAGEQARRVADTLAMASEPVLGRADVAAAERELQRIGGELTRDGGLLAVAFFDGGGRPIAIAARDPDVQRVGSAFFGNPRERPADLRRPSERWAAPHGRYLELTVPVTRIAPPSAAPAGPAPAGQVLGYVTVCASQAASDARARNVALTVLLIGAVAVLVSIPTMYLLVHRICGPIRALVAATDRIAAGDLESQVPADRADVIGELARSFNEMVTRVRHHRRALAAANARLSEANAELAAANASLAGANQDLEGQVRLRTAELERANRRLNGEIAEKDDFLRTVSHDLNAPLRNIAGMAGMVLAKHGDRLDPDVVHRLGRIQKNVEVETDLIAELLELSRIKTRRQRTDPVPIGKLVDEVRELFAQDLETRGIAFEVDAFLPTLVCERARLRQVFQNLVDNAIKYMGDGSAPDALRAAGRPEPFGPVGPDGRVRAIRVGSRPGDVPGEVEFYVRDTGMGFDEADAGNLFRVFRRGKSQAVQAVAGKGVGLAGVKGIVETYGGTVRAEGKLGAGSTFRFTVDAKHVAGSGPVAGPAAGGHASGAWAA
ncbi:MAG: putative two-component system sensor histidine kinase [Phycisphaerales bacterium]|nr:putative two-component system sensor histidine kinase [Phycisphaerales bacterium]